MVALEAGSFASIVMLQRICLRTRAFWPVLTAQLAGNAFSRIVPGGAAAGLRSSTRCWSTPAFPAGASPAG